MKSPRMRLTALAMACLTAALSPVHAQDALETFKELYKKKTADLQTAHDASTFKLEAQYFQQLNVLLEKATADADLDTALAIRDAKEDLYRKLPEGAPRGLTAAKKTFDTTSKTRALAHTKALAKAKSTYLELLETMEVEQTKAGNLDTALAIREEREASQLSKAEIASLDSSRPATRLSTDFFEPKRPDFPLADLKPIIPISHQPLVLGEPDDERSWKSIPPEFEGAVARIYDVDAAKHGGVGEFEVTKSGIVCVIGSWKYQGNNSGGWVEERWMPDDFRDNGWKSLKKKLVRHNDSDYEVFYKHHEAGERVRLRVNKYSPPWFICRAAP